MSAVERQADSLTSAQCRAVEARGNVLVMAGAGTGKTRTLVERCLHCLEHNEAMVDEMLVVTFTEAAAAEMRDRLRKAIEGRRETETPANQSSRTGFWSEQLARFDLAHVGTLHGFCLRLVREHFYDLGLDPHLAILEEGEARQLADEILDEQFAGHYAGLDEFSLSVQELIQSHGGGRDEQIRKLVLQLHKYSQARPDAGAWLAKEQEKFSGAGPVDWLRRLPEAVKSWSDEWQAVLNPLTSANPKAAELTPVLAGLAGLPVNPQWRGRATDLLAQIISGDGNWPKGRKMGLQKPLKGLFEEAKFFHSLTLIKDNQDPLAEDWSWVRGQMETLLRLAGAFAGLLATRKNEDGVLDFHDLEQHAITLLWNSATDQPTAVAGAWRAKLKFVFVDEYQDINAAQDRIIQGLSRDGSGNRFFVGDVKQSIYRFRLAEPGIFREYSRSWRGAAGQTIPLLENFRSQKALLELVNSICRTVMREEIGGVAYDADAELKPGTGDVQRGTDGEASAGPLAELLIRLKNNRGENHGDDNDAAVLDDVEQEARLVGLRVKQLVAEKRGVFDNTAKVFRPVQWRDVAILLRSPRGRAEVFAREFERAGIPLAVARGGFYESAEILDLLSLLQLMDNPLQDVPCIAVLRSPMVSLSLDDLAEIRLAARENQFWTALNRSLETGLQNAEARIKIAKFLERFSRWRKLARLVSLSQCLEEILAETLYVDWLRAQPRGAQRAANVAGFLELAQRFDQFQRQGLFRFLKFVEAQREAGAEPEVPPEASENAVRLMSIHQSKGLEFPVVVLADLSKQFNESDLRGEIIFDEELGLCPKVKPPHVDRRYPSLTHWMAQRRQKRELRGEELRLLYVALTRARDCLILAASVTRKNWDEKWSQPQAISVPAIGAAKCFADWLSLWFSNQAASQKSENEAASAGEFEQLRWCLVADGDMESHPAAGGDQRAETSVERVASPAPPVPGESQMKELRARLEWDYPFGAATRRTAKSSVTALRREAEELDAEAARLFPAAASGPVARQPGRNSTLNAAEIGAAHHKFLQHFDLDRAEDPNGEADRLMHGNYLSADERAVLDVPGLTAFWRSELGRNIRKHREHVRRELPFTARFSPLELEQMTGVKAEAGLEREFVIVQGVADLVALLEDEIWLVDFKTDEVSAGELAEKIRVYSPQIRLYASALEKIFGRKITVRALHFLAVRHTETI